MVLPYSFVALIPLAGALLGRLLAGSVVLEALFSWPGIGQLFAEAVRARDYQVIQALAALSAAMRRAAPAPMPLPPPVTSALWSGSSISAS